ncbi:MAG: helix-turn-helix domain-containing protein, partial [Patescibacteria group bacterium]
MKSIIKNNKAGALDENTKLYLESLGLSSHEITVYSILNNKSQALSAQDVANDLFVFPSALYRIFKKLEALGLIHLVGKKPLRYQASDKNIGLKTAYKLNQESIIQLLNKATNITSLSETKIIIGRQATYNTYIEIAKLANKSIDLYAIGIAYSKDLHQIQDEVLRRGVKIRHVVQQYQPTNFHVINKWKKLG